MESLIQEGKIRGWGLCNDNAYGLTACTRSAKALGVTPPCSIQGDFSLIDRKVSVILLIIVLREICTEFPPFITILNRNFLVGTCRVKRMELRKLHHPTMRMWDLWHTML
jgi:aryl-alcohol dehydrogenase-like predicted oxidoreductase